MSTPEDVSDSEVLRCKFEQLGYGHLLTGPWVPVFIIIILNSDAAGYHASRFSNEWITVGHLPGFVRQEVRATHADLQLLGALVDALEAGPSAGHKVSVLHRHRTRECSLQQHHVRHHSVAINVRGEALGKQLPALTKIDRRLREVDSLNLAVELAAQRQEQLMYQPPLTLMVWLS
jgi:hypothetical protein